MLLHGLGSNGSHFDLDEQHSLARHLNMEGYDVWIVELRGNGLSEKPGILDRSKRWDWDFDTYLNLDLPECISFILAKSGQKKLHWIGHSMGGILLYAWLTIYGDEEIASGAAIASSHDYSASMSQFKAFLPLKQYADYLPPVPIGKLKKWLSPLAGRFENPVETFYYYQPNTEPHIQREVLKKSFEVIPVPLLLQLATAIEPGGMRSRDGKILYGEGLEKTEAPILMIAGSVDAQCPPEATKKSWDTLREKSASRFAVFGKAQGHNEDYGHFDLFVGRNARHEVFPAISEWLTAASPIRKKSSRPTISTEASAPQ